MHARVTSLRNMVANLEDQLKQTSAQLSMAKDSALELESEVNKVQLTADQANRTAEDRERRLNRKAGELQASQEKCAVKYPLVNVYITMENHHFQSGFNYFYGHGFNSYVTNYQRVDVWIKS